MYAFGALLEKVILMDEEKKNANPDISRHESVVVA
jgi:hypothetical protein